MSDPTTDGVDATAAEIEGMVRNLCAYALGEPDPIQRYESLTHQQVLFQGMVEALRRERGRMIADLVVAGLSVTEVAAQTSLGTVVKVRKLVSLAGETQRVHEATAARKEAQLKERDDTASASPSSGSLSSTDPSDPSDPPEPSLSESSLSDPSLPEAEPEPEPEPEPTPSEPDPMSEMMALLEPEPLPLHLAAPTGTRLLTPEDLAALGLPVDGVNRIGRGV